MQKNLF
ncbi:hypothetical protein CGLO_18354 [Colletotrichum gloeosporioides Cg-14]|nr:hypothetical protein CGLO_18354 [Colletotrichum gloeosporioides Cg-14]CVL13911.1 uncharacterized protein FPRN_15190 [Fusarium proliferatum]